MGTGRQHLTRQQPLLEMDGSTLGMTRLTCVPPCVACLGIGHVLCWWSWFERYCIVDSEYVSNAISDPLKFGADSPSVHFSLVVN
jgi:hypothetical protein